ncbi:MAG: flippase-like domain-containing protein [Rhodospirillales bacterium]|nr:flippase-like domain-containing protein [Rhodospirillales bacterium]
MIWRLDFQHFGEALDEAQTEYLVLIPVVISLEQLVRAWKWRQILYSLRPVGTFRLFGAIMAGYLGNLLIPFGVSPILRSWLVARLEGMKMTAVLATVAIDRLIDGVAFVAISAPVLALAVFPDPSGQLRLGLVVGAVGSLTLFAALLWLLLRHKSGMVGAMGWSQRMILRLPPRLAGRARHLLASFAEGIVWPAAWWRRTAVLLASFAIKLIAATHFLWAGLAFGIVLQPLDYLFLIVFLGFLVIVTHFVRLAGGFIISAIFALGLFGVDGERALAMALAVQLGNFLSVAAIGAVSLWAQGVALNEILDRKET